MERRLAAILAVDVVGYSRLMERNEADTFERVRAHRKELFEPKIIEHHGRVFKLTGDGLLAEFASVVDAVECAVLLQQAMAGRNMDLSPDMRIDVRIGLNLGDVIMEDEDRYGEGVNIAARLQALADPGGIAVSGTVVEHARNKLGLEFESLGQHRVKNIAHPVSVYRVALDSATTPKVGNTLRKVRPSRTWLVPAAAILAIVVVVGSVLWLRAPESAVTGGGAQPPSNLPSIVVLPFKNSSDDKEQEAFVDGLTEDLIYDLSSLSGLFVISRNTAFSYKDQEVSPTQIKAELGVGFMLNGSVQRSANRVRIRASLTDAPNGRQIWAGRYDRELTDIFAVQDEVKREIVAALEIKLAPEEQTRATAAPTQNMQSYELYNRGRFAMNLLTRRALRLAYYAFEQAVELDPQFAAAYAQLAMTYALDFTGTNASWSDWVRSPGRARSQAEVLARKAAALDPKLALPDMVMARIALAEWRYDDAMDHARNAVALEPRNAETHATLALTLTAAGRHAEAKQAIDEALRRDPKPAPSTHGTLGIIQFALHDYEGAFKTLELSFKEMIDGGNWFFTAFDVANLGYRGDKDELQYLQRKLFWGTSITAVRFNNFYRDEADMEHLLQGLRLAGVPEFPPELDLSKRAAKPLTGAALAELLSGHDFETLCWVPRLNGEFQFSADGRFTWSLRHDLTDTGTSRFDKDGVCIKMPVITRNREACYSVFAIEGGNALARDYDYAFAGPMLCYFRAKR
jgi:adenylate cyclase